MSFIDFTRNENNFDNVNLRSSIKFNETNENKNEIGFESEVEVEKNEDFTDNNFWVAKISPENLDFLNDI